MTITNFLILGLFIGAHHFHQEPEICSKIPRAFLLLIEESGFTLTYLALPCHVLLLAFWCSPDHGWSGKEVIKKNMDVEHRSRQKSVGYHHTLKWSFPSCGLYQTMTSSHLFGGVLHAQLAQLQPSDSFHPAMNGIQGEKVVPPKCPCTTKVTTVERIKKRIYLSQVYKLHLRFFLKFWKIVKSLPFSCFLMFFPFQRKQKHEFYPAAASLGLVHVELLPASLRCHRNCDFPARNCGWPPLDGAPAR